MAEERIPKLCIPTDIERQVLTFYFIHFKKKSATID